MFNYNVKIKTPNGELLWGGNLPFLPRVGDTIHFNHEYRVVEVKYHFLAMGGNKIPVTILVEREEEKYFVITDNADMAFAFSNAKESEDYCADLRERYNGNIYVFKAIEVHTYEAREKEEEK